jgi:hypothetical protein
MWLDPWMMFHWLVTASLTGVFLGLMLILSGYKTAGLITVLLATSRGYETVLYLPKVLRAIRTSN